MNPLQKSALDREIDDRIAQAQGFKSMDAWREAIREDLAKKERERFAAEEKARLEEEAAKVKAQDAEISEALKSGRMLVNINGVNYSKAKGYQAIACPDCGKTLDFARETLLLALWRASMRGERWTPEWYRSRTDIQYDIVPSGARGTGLIVCPVSLLMQGPDSCQACDAPLEITIQVDCTHDGEPVKSIKRE